MEFKMRPQSNPTHDNKTDFSLTNESMHSIARAIVGIYFVALALSAYNGGESARGSLFIVLKQPSPIYNVCILLTLLSGVNFILGLYVKVFAWLMAILSGVAVILSVQFFTPTMLLSNLIPTCACLMLLAKGAGEYSLDALRRKSTGA
jgi:uncharacterized membrane protein YphA (DoxX/SURF4 family)